MTDTSDCFKSPAALNEAHNTLLEAYGEQGRSEKIDRRIDQFIRRTQATGALLEPGGDRSFAQSLLDYWVTVRYKAEPELPEIPLAPFVRELKPELPDEPCPYVGLKAFDEDRSGIFFGRDELLDTAVTKLAQSESTQGRLLVVFGASGSGKSSMVLAGLIPRLKRGAVPGSETWNYQIGRMVPGSNPLANLAARVSAMLSKPEERVDPAVWTSQHAGLLRNDPRLLAQWLNAGNDQPVVLVVDQFEELFTLCRDDGVRKAFAEALVALVQAPGPRHTVILTMREDFIREAGRLPIPQSLFQGALLAMTAMNEAELREAIEEPAKQVGLVFEKGLVGRLVLEVRLEQLVLTKELEQMLIGILPERQPNDAQVNELLSSLKEDQPSRDVRHEEAALPLLQFTLLELWKRRDRNQITWAAYRSLGGCRRALAHVADKLYGDLTPEEQWTLRRIFIRCLTRITDGTAFVRERVPVDELYRLGEPDSQVTTVLKKLDDAQLVRVTGVVESDQQVEVAHEALLRSWDTLRVWLEEEQVVIRRRQHLTDLARAWDARERREDMMLPGSLLEEELPGNKQPEDLAKELDLPTLVVEFLHASLELRDQVAQRQARELQLAKDLAHEAQEKVRYRNILLVSLAAVAIVAAVVMIRAWQQRTRESESRRLAFAASSMLDSDPEMSLHLALYSIRTNDLERTVLPESESVLRRATQAIPSTTEPIDQGDARALDLAYNPKGNLLAASGTDGKIRIWDVPGQEPPVILDQGKSMPVSSIAFSPGSEGSRLASASAMVVTLWDLSDNHIVRVLDHRAEIVDIAFSPDGTRVATAGTDNVVKLWNALSGELAKPLEGHKADIKAIAYSPECVRFGTDVSQTPERVPSDQKSGPCEWLLATAAASNRQDGEIRFWNADTGKERAELGVNVSAWINDVAFSPDGELLAVADADGLVRVRNIKSGKWLPALVGHVGWVRSVAFSRDGKRLASVGNDKKIRVWDVMTGETLWELQGHDKAVVKVVFSPESGGMHLATAGSDGVIKEWDVGPVSALSSLANHGSPIYSVAHILDGRRLITVGTDEVVRVWAGTSTLSSPSDRGWDVGKSIEIRSIIRDQGPIRALTVTSDGKYVISGSLDGTATISSIEPGQAVSPTVRQLGGPVWDVAYDMDRKRLAAVGVTADGQHGLAKIWEAENQEPVNLDGHPTTVFAVAFSPDGKRVATAGADRVARVWDPRTGTLLLSLPRQPDVLRGIAFSPDGKRLATARLDGRVEVWDVSTGLPLYSLFGDTGAIYDIAYCPNGECLTAVGESGRVYEYTLKGLRELVDEAMERVPHEWEPDQCRRYLELVDGKCPKLPWSRRATATTMETTRGLVQ